MAERRFEVIRAGEEGRRASRWTLPAARFATVAATVLLLVGCGGGHDESAGLAARARSIAAKDLASRPGRAAVLALAADRLEPSVPAELSMLSAALHNSGIERVLTTGGPPLTTAIRTQHLVVGVGADGSVRVWRPSGRLVGEARMGRPAVMLADSTASACLAAVDASGRLTLIDPTDPSRPVIRSLRTSIDDGAPIALAFSADASTIVAVTSRGEVERFDSTSGASLGRWSLREAHGNLPWAGGSGPLRPEAAAFASASGEGEEALLVASPDGSVARVEIASRRGRTILDRGVVPGRVVSLAGMPYADGIAIASTGGVTTLRGPNAEPRVSPGAFADGVGFDLEDHLWIGDRDGVHGESNPWAPLRGPFVGGAAYRIVVGAGGAVAIGPGGAISLLGRQSAGLGLPEVSPTAFAVFDPEGDLLTESGAPGEVDQLETQRPGRETVHGIPTDDPEEETFEPDPAWLAADGSGLYVDAAAVDREFVVVGGQDVTDQGVLMVWDARGGAPLKRLAVTSGHAEKLEPSLVSHVVLLPGKHLVAAYSPVQKVIVFWSTQSWRFVGAVPIGHLTSLSASPDEDELLGVEVPAGEAETESSATPPSRLIFVDIAKLRVDHEVRAGSALAAAWSPNGDRIAVADGEDSVRLLSADGRERAAKGIDVPGTPVTLAWRPDGKAIAVSLGTGVVLADPATGAVSPQLPQAPGQLVAALDWSPDGRLLATTAIEPPTEGEEYVPAAAQVWALGSARLRRRMCQLAGGGLSAAESRRLLGDPAAGGLCRVDRSPPRRKEPGSTGGFEPTLAFRSEGDLYVAGRAGKKALIAKVRGSSFLPVAAIWSRSGLAWAAEGTAGLLPDGGDEAATWACACSGAVALGGSMFALENDGRRMFVFTPGLPLPRSIQVAGGLGEDPRLLGSLGGDLLVGAYSLDSAGGAQSHIYSVDRRGDVAPIGVDRTGVPTIATAQSPSGDELAFSSVNFSGDCGSSGGVGVARLGRDGRIRVSYPPLPFGVEGQAVRSIVVHGAGRVEATLAPSPCDEDGASGPPSGRRYVLDGGGWVPTRDRGFDVQLDGSSVTRIARPGSPTGGGRLTLRTPGGTETVAQDVGQMWVRP
jgi:Anaphase-promoting complex subunit 4 WD40 domain